MQVTISYGSMLLDILDNTLDALSIFTLYLKNPRYI